VKLRSITLVALTIIVFGGACADPSTPGDGSSSPSIARGTAPEDLLLRWGYEGGFTPPEYQLTNLPSFSLYGDGTIVRPGPQIEIYPGPAVPALEAVHVDDEAVASILDAAFEAGLDTVGDLTDMGSVGIADAPETVFTLRAGGVDRAVRVYALGELSGKPPGMPDDEYEARQELIELIDRLGSLETWLPEGSIGASDAYHVTGVRAFVSRHRDQAGLPQPEIEWPLDVPLRDLGEDAGAGYRCVVVTGPEWTERLEPAAMQANQLTPWTSGGRRYAIAFRPLLPDEAAC